MLFLPLNRPKGCCPWKPEPNREPPSSSFRLGDLKKDIGVGFNCSVDSNKFPACPGNLQPLPPAEGVTSILSVSSALFHLFFSSATRIQCPPVTWVRGNLLTVKTWNILLLTGPDYEEHGGSKSLKMDGKVATKLRNHFSRPFLQSFTSHCNMKWFIFGNCACLHPTNTRRFHQTPKCPFFLQFCKNKMSLSFLSLEWRWHGRMTRFANLSAAAQKNIFHCISFTWPESDPLYFLVHVEIWLKVGEFLKCIVKPFTRNYDSHQNQAVIYSSSLNLVDIFIHVNCFVAFTLYYCAATLLSISTKINLKAKSSSLPYLASLHPCLPQCLRPSAASLRLRRL